MWCRHEVFTLMFIMYVVLSRFHTGSWPGCDFGRFYLSGGVSIWTWAAKCLCDPATLPQMKDNFLYEHVDSVFDLQPGFTVWKEKRPTPVPQVPRAPGSKVIKLNDQGDIANYTNYNTQCFACWPSKSRDSLNGRVGTKSRGLLYAVCFGFCRNQKICIEIYL